VVVHPGKSVSFDTDDPRAAAAWISTHVWRPSSETVSVLVPRRDDPRVTRLSLAVVDSKTGAPLRDARLEWLEGTGMPSRVPAGPDGRITLAPRGAPLSGVEALQALVRGYGAVHAPGYRSAYGFGERPMATSRIQPAVESSALQKALAIEVWTERLQRLHPEETERSLHVVDSAGRPVAGAFLVLADVISTPGVRDTVIALGSAIHPSDLGRTFSRTEPDAALPFAVWEDGRKSVELMVDEVPFTGWALSEKGSMASQPFRLRIPERADVEVVVEGTPGPEVRFTMHPLPGVLGSATTPVDLAQSTIPVGLPFEGLEPGLPIELLGSAALAWEGVARGDPPTLRLPVAVGRGVTLYAGARRLDLKPTKRGPMRVVVRLEDLPEVDLGVDASPAKDD
jgi:hypothetical protein